MFAREPQQSQAKNQGLVRSLSPERENIQPARAIDPLVVEQQAQGNQAMLRFAESCPLTLPSPSICPYGGLCDTCPVPVQTKLSINEPGDKYEREANRIAEQVMAMPEPAIQRTPT